MHLVPAWTAVVLGSLALQGVLAPHVGIAGTEPDFVFVVLLAFSMKHGSLPAVYLGFMVGLCQDLYSPSVLGQNALCKTLLGFLSGLFNARMMSTDPLMKAVILVTAFLAHDTLYWLVDRATAGDIPLSLLADLAFRSFPRAVYSLAIAAALYAWQRSRRQPFLA